ncbi:MAG: choice-of-anchor D domain-containing protein, partial [Candidatus Binatus sp.]
MRFVSFTRSIAGFSFALFLLSAFALLILMGGVVTVASAQTGESSTPSAKATKKAKALTVSPKKLNFGELAPLKPSAPATVTIHNPNSIAIEISSIDPQDPEFVPSGNCVRSLAADGNCAVSIVFTASSNGKKSAKLTIVNGASSKSLSVSMTGEGIGTPMPSPTATATATPTATPTATASSDPTATGSATPTATATPVSGAIVLPIEVIGPQGETGTRSFTLTSAQANSAVTFWLQGNHLGYVPSLQ